MLGPYDKILANTEISIPSDWLKIQTIEMHTGGEPLRVVQKGFPILEGANVLEKRRDFELQYDHLRKFLMHEPRGHADMYGCVLTPPNDKDADFGIIFMHNAGYSTMCGHAIIAITKLAVMSGWVPITFPETKVTIDAPCGRIVSFAKIEKDESVSSVYFYGVPSFVLMDNQKIEVENWGTISFSVAYGGAFYALVNATEMEFELTASNYSKIIEAGKAIKNAIKKSSLLIEHPFEKDLSFLYGTIFWEPSEKPGIDSRNVCVFAEGEVDRCPTGSGVSARMPFHYSRGEIAFGESLTIESIIDSVFKGSIHELTHYGPYEAVVPRVEGTAFLTGQNQFFLDPKDPIQQGFFLR